MGLKNETRALAESILSENQTVEGELEKVGSISREDIDKIAQDYASKPSTFLAAVVGAVVGASGGISFATYLGGLAVISGPAGMAIGAAVAVLGWRGRSMWRHERAQDNYDTAVKKVDRAIKAVSRDTNRREYDDLIAMRQELTRAYVEVALTAISSDDKQTVAERMLRITENATVPSNLIDR